MDPRSDGSGVHGRNPLCVNMLFALDAGDADFESKMLVLALQFSRGKVTRAELDEELDAAASCRRIGVNHPTPSKRKRRR